MITGVKGFSSGIGGAGTPVAESLSVVRVTGENGFSSGVGGGGTPVAVSLSVVITTGLGASWAASALVSLKKAKEEKYAAMRVRMMIRPEDKARADKKALNLMFKNLISY